METKPLPPVFLSGKLINLHLLDAEHHLNDCLLWLNDKQLTRFLITGRFPQYPEAEKNWFNKATQEVERKITLAIHKKDNGEYIGMMGLEKINYIHRTATSGSFIGSESNRGRGYGHDAKMILLNYAFNSLNLRKINASAVAFNERSLRFNQACGYKIEATLKQQLFVEGQYYDEIMLAVYAEDFQPLWNKYLLE